MINKSEQVTGNATEDYCCSVTGTVQGHPQIYIYIWRERTHKFHHKILKFLALKTLKSVNLGMKKVIV